MDTLNTIAEASTVTPWPHQLYSDAEEFWSVSKGLHHAYLVYRTLRGDYKHIFQPDSVFYVGNSPAAYLKKVNTNQISDDDIRQWQRFLWNQTVVPLLIVKSLTRVHVYTAYTKPEKEGSKQRIQSILENVAGALELDQLWTVIESGMIYREKPDAFSRNNAVDRELLRNLNYTAIRLAETQKGSTEKEKDKNLEFTHHFLTRLLFVCNLIERGMIGKHFTDTEHKILQKLKPATKNEKGYFLRHLLTDLKTIAQKREALCRIFGYVKRIFNGSLFPDTIEQESERYNDSFIQVIDRFLQRDDIETGQQVLGFWAYDFSVIPIETISAVYESFLGEQGKLKELQEGEDTKRTTGAYYTPLHLAELTVDIALEDIEEKTNKKIHELKILDPACGSGVFLVSLFGRMAESLRRVENHIQEGPCIDWARKLLPLLHQLYGIDRNPTACHITCFSLYLALLEQLTPMHVEYLRKHNEKLPPLLANTILKSFNTIYHGNLFDPELSLNEQNFDVVIGNPPWVSRKNQKDVQFLKWLDSRDSNVYGPEKQIAHGFMWETPKYLSDSGVACLLLPASVLLNEHTNQFQKEWFKSVTVERVVNFSDLRFILFEAALHPCVAIKYKPSKSNPGDMIRYESPKTDIRLQKGGPVYIREEDTVYFEINKIIKTTEENVQRVWKAHYWGTWRDYRLLSRLDTLPKLYDLTGKNRQKGKRWDKTKGITLGNKNNKGWWSKEDFYLGDFDKISAVVVEKDCQTVEEAIAKNEFSLNAERPRKEHKDLFLNPKVLISAGSNDMKVAFCNFSVLFQDSIQIISGHKNGNDQDLLRFLSLVIKSGVVQYYLFHNSSTWGIERDKIYSHEILSLPFYLPEDASNPKRAKEIIDKAAYTLINLERQIEKHKWFGEEQRRKDRVDEIRGEFEPLIREYYDIDKYESMLIDDTLNLAVKSFHPRENTAKEKIPTLIDVNDEQTKEYAKTLCEMLNNFGEGSKFKVKGEVYKGMPYSVVHISLSDRIKKDVPILESKEDLAKILQRMGHLLQQKRGQFVFCQNLKVFDKNSLYILKPMQMRFWSRTAALNDADEIAGSIIQTRRGI